MEVVKEVNPDEILLEDEDEEEVKEVVSTKVEDVVMKSVNPDEISLEDDEEDTELLISEEPKGANCSTCTGNPDEIDLDEDEEEEEDEIYVESMLLGGNGNSKGKGKQVEEEVVDGPRITKFLALNKPGGGKDFLQVSCNFAFKRQEWG